VAQAHGEYPQLGAPTEQYAARAFSSARRECAIRLFLDQVPATVHAITRPAGQTPAAPTEARIWSQSIPGTHRWPEQFRDTLRICYRSMMLFFRGWNCTVQIAGRIALRSTGRDSIAILHCPMRRL